MMLNKLINLMIISTFLLVSCSILTQVDSSPPIIKVNNPPEGGVITTLDEIIFDITYTDNKAGVDLSSLEIILNGIPQVKTVFDITKNKAVFHGKNITQEDVEHTNAILSLLLDKKDGNNQLTVRIKDKQGNLAEAIRCFYAERYPIPWAALDIVLEPVDKGSLHQQGIAGKMADKPLLVKVLNAKTKKPIKDADLSFRVIEGNGRFFNVLSDQSEMIYCPRTNAEGIGGMEYRYGAITGTHIVEVGLIYREDIKPLAFTLVSHLSQVKAEPVGPPAVYFVRKYFKRNARGQILRDAKGDPLVETNPERGDEFEEIGGRGFDDYITRANMFDFSGNLIEPDPAYEFFIEAQAKDLGPTLKARLNAFDHRGKPLNIKNNVAPTSTNVTLSRIRDYEGCWLYRSGPIVMTENTKDDFREPFRKPLDKLVEVLPTGQIVIQGSDEGSFGPTLILPVGDTEEERLIYQRAVDLAKNQKFSEAIEEYGKILKVRPNDQIALYNTACAYALKNDKKLAIKFLKKAIKAGFTDFNHIRNDPDLANIRNEEGYKKLVEGK